jgi:GMP synthase-like glutamine amidotransferase
MRALSIAHQADAGPGVFTDVMRAHGVEHDIWTRSDTEAPPADPAGYDAVLVFGGAMHADQEDRHPWLREEKAMLRDLIDRRLPLLGVCLGAQLVAEAAGAPARRAAEPEIGWHDVEVTDAGVHDPLLAPLAPRFEAFQWHSYEFPLPPGATPLARSAVCLQAYRLGDSVWGIQFHAEVTAADADAWIDDYRSDEDAVRTRVDPEALRRQTDQSIDTWNEVGRALCERFLAQYRGGFAPT